MKTRRFGKTGKMVSEIGLGTWQLGTVWGDPFNEAEAFKILEAANETGINFIDTADVYNGSKSEIAIGNFLKSNGLRDKFYITSKCGRKLNPHVAEGYTPEAIEGFVDDSLSRMQLEQLDMMLLHCPPTSVYKKDEIFTALDKMVESGKLAAYGVSIEKVAEGLQAMEYNISAMEVIFNMFRLKPVEELFPRTKENDIAVIARVPLASGLLTGKYTKETTFGPNDHRTYNRDGSAFDKGETFSGVDFNLGLEAVEALKDVFKTDNLIPYALRYILMHDEVSVVIPGASKVEQVYSNVQAANMNDLTTEQMQQVKAIYDKYIRATVHNNW